MHKCLPGAGARSANATDISVLRTTHSGAKTILHGTVKGGRKRGRQKKRREDHIREGTGPEFTKFQRAVKNKEK